MTRRTAFATLAAAALVAAMSVGCASLDDFQRKVIFRPNKEVRETPAEYRATYEDVWLDVGTDGGGPRRLHAWWIPSARPEQAPAVLYLHGAGFGISANLSRIMKLRDEGFSVLAPDYRGFGRSDGDLPSEDSAYEDAEAAWSELARRAPAAPRFIYGHSLGGAIAIELAQRASAQDAAGLVVESSFTSVREMQQYSSYKWIPLAAVQTQFFDALAKAPRLCLPALFLHGTNDYRVPVDVAKKLYDAAAGPKLWLLVEGARHVDIPTRYTQQWSAALRDLRGLADRRLASVTSATSITGAARATCPA
ncbi:MAG: alpha/beta fold hydrolase [Betaproteobacteria bacterium]|nr:alpha/beta fold hydrolase [Betaproteobacteria bacterium]MBK9605870.1 alpha/beta fold hydrolase [Betaproteobacteria bacterium]